MSGAASNLRHILKWGSFMGLLPFYNDKTKLFKPRKYYSYLTIVLLLSICAHSLYVDFNFEIEFGSHFVFEVLDTSVSVLISAHTIYKSSSDNVPKLQLLFDTLDEIDVDILSVDRIRPRRIRWILPVTVLSNVFVVSLLMYNFGIIAYYIPTLVFLIGPIENYYVFVGVMIELYLLSSIQERFGMVNRGIRDLQLTSLNLSVGDNRRKVDVLTKLHTKLHLLVDTFNEIFGWHVLSTVFLLFIDILSTINFFIKEVVELSSTMSDVAVLIYILVQQILLTKKCEYISRDGRLSMVLSYRTLMKYIYDQQSFQNLFLLCKETSGRSFALTAAGFFNVNYEMLFMLFNLLATYVLVSIQIIGEK